MSIQNVDHHRPEHGGKMQTRSYDLHLLLGAFCQCVTVMGTPAVGAQPGKIEILEPSRLPMASIYFFSPHSLLSNGVLIIEKYYRGAELEISLIWNLMTQSRS